MPFGEIAAAKENAELKNKIDELNQQLSDKHEEKSALLKTNGELKIQEMDARNELVVKLATMKIENDAKQEEVRIPFDLKIYIRENLSVSVNFTVHSGEIETRCHTSRTRESQTQC